MAGAADIGIRIFLDNAASAGLNQINGQLGQLGTLANRNGSSMASMSAATAVSSGAMLGAAAAFGLFAIGIKYSLDAASEFQQAMFSIAVATHVPQEEAMKYSNTLMDLGAKSTYTSAEIAQGVAVLGRSGYGINDIFTKMAGAGVALGIATRSTAVEGFTLLAAAMTSYQAPAQDALHYANLLQYGFEHQTGSVAQFTSAMTQVTPIAALVGTPLREVVAALDVVGPAMGSTTKAGTAVRYMLSGLLQPTAGAQKEMAALGLITVSSTSPAFVTFADKLMAAGGATQDFVNHNAGSVTGLQNLFKAAQGVGLIPLDTNFNQWAISNGMLSNKLYDSTGHAKDLTAILGMLSEKLKGMPDSEKLAVLKNLFSVRGGQGADILLAQIGKYNAELKTLQATGDNTNGVMRRQQEMMNTLKGASQGLATSFRDLGVAVGLAMLPAATAFVTHLNEMVSAVRRMAIANPEAAATFLKVGLAVSGLGVAFAIAVLAATPIGMLIMSLVGTMLAIIAVTTLVTAVWMGLMNMFRSGNVWLQLLAGIISGALIGALVALTLALGYLAVTAIASFIATIAPAIAAGAAWVLAFLPFILIGAAIGLVVVGIILVIRNWGAIAHWLQGIWAGVLNWIHGQWILLGAQAGAAGNQISTGFRNGLNAVVGFFRNIGGQIGAQWNLLGSQLHAATINIGNGIRTAFQAGLTAVQNIVHGAVNAIVGFFAWLYNHNYYFHDFVDACRKAFQLLAAVVPVLVQGMVNSVVQPIQAMVRNVQVQWALFVTQVTTAFRTVSSNVSSFFGQVGALFNAGWALLGRSTTMFLNLFNVLIVSRVASAASSFMSGLQSMIGAVGAWYNNLNDRVTSAMSGFQNAIRSGIMGGVAAMQTGLNNLMNLVNGLGSLLYQAGQNAMQMLANGITAAVGAVVSAAQGAAAAVAKNLGFHSPPKAGPLSDSDQYMPNMMKMYASGIQQHTPLVTGAIQNVSGAIAATNFSMGNGNNPSNIRGGGNTTVNLVVDNKVLTQLVMNNLTGQLQMNGQSRMMR